MSQSKKTSSEKTFILVVPRKLVCRSNIISFWTVIEWISVS